MCMQPKPQTSPFSQLSGVSDASDEPLSLASLGKKGHSAQPAPRLQYRQGICPSLPDLDCDCSDLQDQGFHVLCFHASRFQSMQGCSDAGCAAQALHRQRHAASGDLGAAGWTEDHAPAHPPAARGPPRRGLVLIFFPYNLGMSLPCVLRQDMKSIFTTVPETAKCLHDSLPERMHIPDTSSSCLQRLGRALNSILSAGELWRGAHRHDRVQRSCQ